ncbi:spore germination protein [Fodinisporobacter ferrooxydans]|uniref:Spore germination protein n=1 Tax=Fodinisporobacter ferrooxydans TaxID=2901836 RepID=A0ABY4CHE3_9BACL|nr:spore germination protein [Alicyclobacillaceae bacterium MYW30-H2]
MKKQHQSSDNSSRIVQGLSNLDDWKRPLFSTLEDNQLALKSIFSRCSDVVFREFQLLDGTNVLCVYVNGMVAQEELELTVIEPLLEGKPIRAAQKRKIQQLDQVASHILEGDTAILADAYREATMVSLQQYEKRSIAEPLTEAVIRGSREGFIESIATNMMLIRRRIRSPKLKAEIMQVGTLTRTDVAVMYIEGLADPDIVGEVQNRIQAIEIDGILESGYIEEFITDTPYTVFPLIQDTERPDVVVAGLLEGRVAILVDGTPFALLAPMTFWVGMQAAEDYYVKYVSATLVRWVRYMFLFIALLLPSIYVAISTFHQEMLPTNLLISVAAARESSPFPAFIEALFMEITFEALREAGVRLPRPVGQSVSIVGGLVIGQAAVQAGIVSAPMVIVVSITGIASFIIPRFSTGFAIRMLRFPMIFLAGTLGLYGIVLGMLALLIHLASLRSFGIPYFSPLAPLKVSHLKDVFVRAPLWSLTRRPVNGMHADRQRMAVDQKPSPEDDMR